MPKTVAEKPGEEGLIPCPYCSCRFLSYADLHAHLEALGFNANEHAQKFRALKERWAEKSRG